MSYFPFFKDVNGAKVLIIGGGQVALRRASALNRCGASVRCIAPEFCDGFEQLPIQRIVRSAEPTDLEGADIVIMATDDAQFNASMAQNARQQGKEVSVCDDPAAGSFLFPSLVCVSGMTVGISSQGASPLATKYVREQIEQAIPENFEDVLSCMEIARSCAKELIPEPKARASALRKLFEFSLNAPFQPDAAAIKDMIRRFRSTELD